MPTRRSKQFIILACLGLTSCLTLNPNANAQKSLNEIPKELLGQPFDGPTDTDQLDSANDVKGLKKVEIYIPIDQGDWDRIAQIEFDEASLSSIRLYGFSTAENRDPIDVTFEDESTLMKFKAALSTDRLLRKAMSDIGRTGGAVGIGAFRGIMRVNIQGEQEPLIIGVGQAGFYLDVYYGSDRQTFFGRALALTLAEALDGIAPGRSKSIDLDGLAGANYLRCPSELEYLAEKYKEQSKIHLVPK